MAVPNAIPFSIGGVTFSPPLEAPMKLPIGSGAHTLVVTPLPGGGRIVAGFGAQPKPVQWIGTIQYANVNTRVSTLRSYMVDGKERLLTWGSERYYCKVKDFTPSYWKGGLLCDYSIEVEITRDANGAFTITSPTSSDSLAADLLNGMDLTKGALNIDPTVISAAAATQSATLDTSLNNIKLAVQGAGPLSQASPSQITAVLATVNTALAQAQTLSTLLPTGTPFVSGLQLVAQLTSLANVIQQGDTQATIVQQGGTLFELASMYFGDPTKALNISSFNGLASPILSSVVPTTLRIQPGASS